jgi:hypothetical protein
VILNYIQNSGTAYNLGATEIVYLRNEGVSDRVLTAMLDQKRRVIETATTNAQVAQAQAPGSTQIYNVQQAPVQPAPVYVQYPPPEPASTVHVIPYPAARAAYYGTSGYYPYLRYPYYAYGYPGYSGYSGYWWGGPSISLGFGFGFGGYHHHHHGWHGGW